MKKAFTLIELLIVIGILSVLVVTILITLNPAEAQKKARDTKRLKDMATLQAIVEQYLADGKQPFCTAYCTSTVAAPGDTCSTSWIREIGPGGAGTGNSINLCNYAQVIPIEPLKGGSACFIRNRNGEKTCPPSVFRYELKMLGSDYVIRTRLESSSNGPKIMDDGDDGTGGTVGNQWYQVGSKLDLL